MPESDVTRLALEALVAYRICNEVEVETAEARGRSGCLVTTRNGRGYFVKLPSSDVPWLPSSVPAASPFYRHLWAAGSSSEFLKFTPPIVILDEGTGVVVFDGLTRHRSVAAVLASSEEWTSLTVRLSEMLAALHCQLASTNMRDIVASRAAPPVPNLRAITPEDIAQGPHPGYVEYVKALQGFDGLSNRLDYLRDSWTPDALMHGDAKLDNLMIGREGPQSHDPDICIVDWDLAGYGEPEWDVGSVVGSLFYQWSLRHRLNTGLVRSDKPIDIHSAVRAFLVTYATARNCNVETIVRAVAFAGVFLLHASMGATVMRGDFDAHAKWTAMFGSILATNPVDAAEDMLFGDNEASRIPF